MAFYNNGANPTLHLNDGDKQEDTVKKLRRPTSNTNLGQNRFKRRVGSDWNSLPEVVVSAESVNDFKNRLDEYFNDQSVYDYDY